MTALKPLHVLFWLAVASPLLALIPQTQDPAAVDWPKEVERACTAQRYGLRLAAGKKVAAAGGVAVPAIRDHAARRGKNELPVSLVEAIAEQDTADAPVLDLLTEWATDRDFYWRAQALKGLARRGPLLTERRTALTALFASHHDDPAWLARVHARLGTALLGGDVAGLVEHDPRAATKLCALLLQHGKLPNLQPLFDALLDERTFLAVPDWSTGDPWGQRRATEAFKALKAWLGDAHPLADGEAFTDKPTAIDALLAAAGKKSGQQLRKPEAPAPGLAACAGGIEILSCRNGDLFVQWTAGGELRFGIEGGVHKRLPAPVWDALSKERTALRFEQNHGVVVCDSMRLCWAEPKVHTRVAPGALPAPAAKWLEHLALALQEAEEPALAAALRAGLEQFGPR